MSKAPATLPNWDLTPFFSDLGAPDYVDFRARLGADAAALRDRATALPALAEAPAAWVDALLALEDVGTRLRHIGSYLGCRTAADASDEAAGRDSAGLDAVRTDLDKAFVAVRAGFAAADDAT